MRLVMEMQQEGVWKQVGATLGRGDAPASISSHEDSGRQVYVFGWMNGEGPSLWRATGGLDTETPAQRVLYTQAFELVADLAEASYEMKVFNQKLGALQVRFRTI